MAWRAVGLLALSFLVCLHVLLIAQAVGDPTLQSDVTQEYLLAQAVAHGADPYAPLPELAARWLPAGVGNLQHPTPYPIFVGWLSLPMAALTFGQAAVAWLVLEVLFVACGVWLIGQILDLPLAPGRLLVVAVSLLGWFPLAHDLRFGQLSILLTLLFLASWWALDRGQRVLAGMCLGVAVLLKFTGLPVLLLLALHRRWAVVVTAGGLVAGAHVAWILLGGWPQVLHYYTVVAPSVGVLYAHNSGNLSAWRAGRWLVGPLAPVVPLAAMVLLMGVAARARDRRTHLPLAFGGGLFLMPVAWVHYFVMTLPALAVLYLRLRAAGWPRWPTVTAATALVLTSVPGTMVHAVLGITAMAVVPAVSMCALLLLFAWSDGWDRTTTVPTSRPFRSTGASPA